MKRDEYYAAIEAYKANRVEHGGEWKKHKYIRIENGRYIYPEDEKAGSSSQKSSNSGGSVLGNIKNAVEKKAFDVKSAFHNTANAVSNLMNNRHDASYSAQEKAKAEAAAKAASQKEAEAKKAESEARNSGRVATEQYKKAQVNKAYNEARTAGRIATEEYKKQPQQQTRGMVNTKGTARKEEDVEKATPTSGGSNNFTKKSPRERIQSGEATPDQIRNEIKTKSDAMKKECEEMAKKYAGGGASVEAVEFEADTGAPKRFIIKDSRGNHVLDTGDFLEEYDGWNYAKKVQHSFSSPEEYRAAINAYKAAKRSVPR